MSGTGRSIQRPASQPEGNLACDFTIAVSEVGLRERLEAKVLGPPREIAGGIEVAFQLAAWHDVQRYIDVESRCCPFLNLAAEHLTDMVLLRVTGRPEARELIHEMFGVRAQHGTG